MHHILRKLVRNYPTNLPSLSILALIEGQTHLKNRKCVEVLQNFHADGTEDAEIMKLLLPLFNIRSFTFERDEVDVIKKFRSKPCVKAWVNNILVYQDLTLPFPSTYAMEKIIFEGKFKNLEDTLLKLNSLNNV